MPSFVAARFASDGLSSPECQPFPTSSFLSAIEREKKEACVSLNCGTIRVIAVTYVLMQSIQNQRLEFVQAVIDSRSSPLFHDRFRGSPVLAGSFVRWFLWDFDVEARHGGHGECGSVVKSFRSPQKSDGETCGKVCDLLESEGMLAPCTTQILGRGIRWHQAALIRLYAGVTQETNTPLAGISQLVCSFHTRHCVLERV